jgi:hypothetical protein
VINKHVQSLSINAESESSNASVWDEQMNRTG